MIHVSHFVGLSGVGGVQRNFSEYINNKSKSELDDGLSHKIYTLGTVDQCYKFLVEVDVHDIRKLKNLFSLILDIVSRKKIVHFYNNLPSLKVAILLLFLPVHKIILHERGAIWNSSSVRIPLLRFVAWKASLILANSNATKIMLEKRLNIYSKKIRVLHNGIDTTIKCKGKSKYDYTQLFRVGFIGRLDTPKGVHVLVDAMRYLVNDNVELTIVGDGVLKNFLKERAKGINHISFVGRVENPYSFLNDFDLLVVPSIREPLGNVCLEAGLCKVPVLASNVDGIPEIIKDGITGELMDATEEVSINTLRGAVPVPEFVVDPVTRELCIPKQIDPSLLAIKILELSADSEKLKCYADKLHDEVIKYFNINRYSTELHMIYREIISL